MYIYNIIYFAELGFFLSLQLSLTVSGEIGLS
jgi:hypothetical protein